MHSGSPGDDLALGFILSLEWAWSRSLGVFKFPEISDISEMEQTRDT